jgi:hypothetical protein
MRRAAALGILLFMPLCAWGCSVPVFMFALENWKGSPHTLRVAAADMNAAERLLGAGRANLMIVLADNVAAGQADLCYPGDDRPWATMSLTQADPGAITESPARTEIARRLLAGDAVVWLLLDSGDAEVDARTRALLKERLDNIAAAVVLHRQANPALDPADAMQGEPPVVKIVFATVEVHANDPAEIWLVREIDHLAPSTGGPRLVPIFGRARAWGFRRSSG